MYQTFINSLSAISFVLCCALMHGHAQAQCSSDFDIILSDGSTASGNISICQGETIILEARNQAPGLSYSWDFKDGTNQTTDTSSISHTYTNSSTFDIELTVSGQDCEDKPSSVRSITVIEQPSASFSVDLNTCSGDPVAFTNSSTPNSSGISYQWNFGDGSSSSNNAPTHTYNISAGTSKTFESELIVRNSYQSLVCTDTARKAIQVANPSVVISSPSSIYCPGKEIAFQSTTKGQIGNLSYNWDFGDPTTAGDQSSNPTPMYAYNDIEGNGSETRNVTLTVTDAAQCQAEAEKELEIVALPDLDIIAERDPSSPDDCSGVIYNFQIIGEISDNLQYEWRFGDQSETATGSTSSHQYLLSEGQGDVDFNVTLTVTNTQRGLSCSKEVTTTVRVEQRPIAEFEPKDNLCSNEAVVFENKSRNGPSLSYDWDFGDEESSNLSKPSHNYDFYGQGEIQSFPVTLIATNDSNNCKDTVSQEIAVKAQPTLQGIDISDNSLCSGLEVQFSNINAQGTALTYNWDFGDGNQSNEANPTHIYKQFGTGRVEFDPKLTITNSVGCETQESGKIEVLEQAELNFKFASPRACIQDYDNPRGNADIRNRTDDVYIDDLVEDLTVDWGDGNTEVVDKDFSAQEHEYFGFGAYPIIITSTNNNDCKTTERFQFVVESTPTARVEMDNRKGCEPFDGLIINNSFNITPTTTFILQFGDGEEIRYKVSADSLTGGQVDSTVYRHPHQYFANCVPGTDDSGTAVTLIAQNECTSGNNTFSRIFPIDVYPKVEALFESDSVACLGLPSTFTNRSTPPACNNSDSTYYIWDWGDGSPNDTSLVIGDDDPQEIIGHTFNELGLFTVTLAAYNLNSIVSCDTAYYSEDIYVCEPPSTSFEFAYRGDSCVTDIVDFQSAGELNCASATWSVTPATGFAFIEGTNENSASPAIEFSSPGVYRVSLVEEGICGIDSSFAEVLIKGPPILGLDPIADTCQLFEYTPKATFDPNGGTISDIFWSFNEGTPQAGTGRNPSAVTFSGVGAQTIRLTATNECGSTTVSESFNLAPLPPAAVADDAIICRGESVELGGGPETVGNTYEWSPASFLDNNTSANPTAQPDNTVEYKLVETNSLGCADSSTVKVTVNQLPVADFQSTTSCLGDATQFTDASEVTTASSIQSWRWDFGDGGNSSEQNPQHTYAFAGSFNVTLTVIDDLGCSHSITKEAIVRSLPSPSFTSDQVCLGEFTEFSDASSSPNGNIIGWKWDFGDGASSSNPSPTYQYTDAGSYTIRLEVEDEQGCINSIEELTVVDTLPNARFTASEVCLGQATTFKNESTSRAGTLNTWIWDFGDGTIDTLSNGLEQEHTYSQDGDYQVTLTVGSTSSCYSQITKTVSVKSLPIPGFNVSPVCLGEESIFADNTVATDGRVVTSWSWDFGNGQGTSSRQFPSYTYSQGGVFEVTLAVRDSEGCENSTSANATVYTLPDASFDFSNTCQEEFTSFNSTSSSDNGDITAWSWDLGDNTTSSLPSFNHKYPENKDYNVRLSVEDSRGCQNRTEQVVTISPLPTADFTANTACLGNTTSFQDASVATGGQVAHWRWDFGDGKGTSDGQNPSYIYDTEGTYTVELQITDQNGCSSTVRKEVIVNPLPEPDFSRNAVCLNEATLFQNTSITPPGAIDRIRWDFGDGTSLLNEQSPSHIYQNPGEYTATLTIRDTSGCSESISKLLRVHALPKANFTAEMVPIGIPSEFVDQSVSAGESPISQWLWDFGDGSDNATVSNPVHTYSSAGVYDVSLSIIDENACADTVIKQALVNPLPKPDFTATPSCLGSPTRFFDASEGVAGNIASWLWDFGDGNGSSNLPNPSYTFARPGEYTVSLTITDINGSSNTLSKVIEVYRPPLASFDNSTVCLGIPSSFANTSQEGSAPLTSYRWDFGDGNGRSSAESPTYTYANSGNFNASLIIIDANGCRDTAVNTVGVQPRPSADFEYNVVCQGESTSFTDQSANGGVPLTGWSWSFGDGAASSLPSPTHQYGEAGNYTVSLTVTNSNGCQHTTQKTVKVNGLPEVGFSASNACLGQETGFIGNPSIVGEVATWNWDFDDGNASSNQQNPKHIFSETRTFNVSLSIEDPNGCQNQITKPVTIYPLPKANFQANTVCEGEATSFTDLSQVSGSPIAVYEWDFGDGSTSRQTEPKHVYANAGTYNATLKVTDQNGCSHLVNQEVTVRPRPNVEFQNSTACLGDSTAFIPQANTEGIPIQEWEWDFGNGNTSQQKEPKHLYANAGEYNVRLTVTDQHGCQSFFIKKVKVDELPDVGFSAPPTCFGEEVAFQDQSQSEATISTWSWDFGDGKGTASSPNPSYRYEQPGVYQVSLSVADSKGCRATLQKDVFITEPPTANFRYDTACVGSSTSFFDETDSQTAITAWQWDFGDGSSSSSANPTHTFVAAGTYNVQLSVTEQGGCTATISKVVRVLKRPEADFRFTAACLNSPIAFEDLSSSVSGDIIGWNWDFGDGRGVSNLQNPEYAYSSAGIYSASLTVTNANGCQSTVSKDIEVQPLPEADFSANTVCLGSTTLFQDLSDGPRTITDWSWDFGDNKGISNQRNPSYTYEQPGTYLVTLEVIDLRGCRKRVAKQVEVIPLPQPNFSASAACLGSPTVFTDLSSDSTQGLSGWSWDFGDGNGSTEIDPVHSYQFTGTYQVSLTITNAYGCQNTITKPVNVNTPPTSLFTAENACYGETVSFFNNAVGSGSPITSYEWRFGDGTRSFSPNPQHLYDSIGTFSVTLTVGDANGCQSSSTQEVTIRQNPVSDFRAASQCAGNSIAFTDESLAPEGAITNWFWDFGDGQGSSIAASPSYTYSEPGEYSVRLRVVDEFGCSGETAKSITVYPNPEASFEFNTACLSEATNFTDTSIGNGRALVAWEWDFGDGTVSNSQSPSHQFDSGGTYSVRLTVTDERGCSASTVKPVTIRPKPSARLEVEDACLRNPSDFQDLSVANSGNLLAWEWRFGDGNTSEQRNPSHTYQNAGDYDVSLIVTDSYGCTDTATAVATVRFLPNADFEATTECLGDSASFRDLSDGVTSPISSWTWKFGDGSVDATVPNPSHLYTDTGFYDVTLYVENMDGCRDNITKRIYAKPLPAPDFRADTACFGFPTTFEDFSQEATSSITRWEWDFGDGIGFSNAQNPVYTYIDHGLFEVSLTVTDINGCTASMTKKVLVNPLPEPDFSVENTCLGTPAQFKDLSFSGGGDIVYWEWDFGDGSGSNEASPSHLYQEPNNYRVKLIVRDEKGCVDSVSQQIYISPPPLASFSYDEITCQKEAVQFTDQSASSNGPIVEWDWDFGDGRGSSFSQNPEYAYQYAGEYTVTLSITDANGCKDSFARDIAIDSIPYLEFDSNIVCLGDSTFFINRSEGTDDNLYQWNWSFGDGNNSLEASPSHLYAEADTFTVRLEVVDINGCQNMLEQPSIVHSTPVASFLPDTVCLEEPLVIENLSYNIGSGIASVRWEFGDGSGSQQFQPPAHFYQQAGLYDVKLVLENSSGCADSVIRTVVVHPKPQAGFVANQVCQGEKTQFLDESKSSGGEITAWSWDFGNGAGTSINQSPSYIYPEAGIYEAKLAITDANSCMDTAFRQVKVDTLPVAAFSYNNICFTEMVYFNDLSVGTSGNITSWHWDFGDDKGTSTEKNPIYTYRYTGIYDVTLTVTDVKGCQKAITQKVVVESDPVANFRVDTACANQETVFTDLSYNTVGGIKNWHWDFGDGNSSSEPSPSHTYSSTDTFQVQLAIETMGGCRDTLSKGVIVNPQPETYFTYERACDGNPVVFEDRTESGGAPLTDWFWDFGDGAGTSIQQNPSYTFIGAGDYPTSLTVADSNGCRQTLVRQVKVDTLPFVDFEIANACLGSTSLFTDRSYGRSSNIVEWYWEFGDSTTSAQQNPQHVYEAEGVYRVRLSVLDTNGCQNTIEKEINIYPEPVAHFTHAPVCLNTPTRFEDLSYAADGGPVAWRWDFGDGASSSEESPLHSYARADTFEVALRITAASGCTDTYTESVVVHPLPVADFYAAKVCEGNNTVFADESSSANGAIQYWDWSFGNGASDSTQNPIYLYPEAGDYTVGLSVTDTLGCVNDTSLLVVIDTLPVADFSTEFEACLGSPNAFEDLSKGRSGNIVRWEWDFGNGQYSQEPNPTMQYSAIGSYRVRLTVTDDDSCQHSIDQTVRVRPKPVAGFTYQSSCQNTATSFYDASENSEDIVQWIWDFGDGRGTSNEQNPEYVYEDAGDYRVQLAIVSGQGCRDTIVQAIEVSPSPAPDFSADTVCLGDATSFTDLSQPLEGDILSWDWDFGDGKGIAGGPSPTYTFTEAGQYNVTLTIQDESRCRASISKKVMVRALPQPSFGYTRNCLGEPITFQDFSAGSAISNWRWDFGDEQRSFQQSPQHTYQEAGVYAVRLRVTDQYGCQNSITKEIVADTLPDVKFETTQSCVGVSKQFTDLSAVADPNDEIIAWHWTFGDGSSASVQNPEHEYAYQGLFFVSLEVTTAKGCSHKVGKQVRVFPRLEADFSYNRVCEALTTTFSDSSASVTGAIVEWEWDFGDGTIANEQNPDHIYQSSGDYTVSLIAIDDVGCRDTARQQITVNPRPAAAFEVDGVCHANTSTFISTSTSEAGADFYYTWNLGDGTQKATPVASHTYASPGVYEVSLKVVDENGCLDTQTQEVTIHALPAVDFSVDSGTYCAGAPVQFDNLSTGTTAQLWDFDNGLTSTEESPSHVYSQGGLYTVQLIGTSAQGCQDSARQKVEVKEIIRASFQKSASAGCGPLEVYFLNTTPETGPSISYEWDFGNGMKSLDRTPQTVMFEPSLYGDTTYYITLSVISDTCGISVEQDSIVVRPFVSPSFELDSDSLCSPAEISFENTTIGLPNRFEWDFGDGSPRSTEPNPSHIYTTSDRDTSIYSVTLYAYNACSTGSFQREITVFPNTVTAFFNTEADFGCAPFEVQFQNFSQGTDFFTWDFGDGTLVEDVRSPIHTYDSGGTYEVKLYATDGCSYDTASAELRILPSPATEFTLSQDTLCLYDTLTAYATNDNLANANWDFGDGSTAQGFVAKHLYSEPGLYSVRLNGSSIGDGCPGSTSKVVFVRDAPNASFEVGAAVGCQPYRADFVNRTEGAISYQWSFGDGTEYSTERNPTHTFYQSGRFEVLMKAVGINQCAAEYRRTMEILPQPTASFDLSSQASCGGPVTVSLSNTSSDGAAAFKWSLGNGSTSVSTNELVTYTEVGEYEISLIATSLLGCPDTAGFTYRVYPVPQASFQADPTSSCLLDTDSMGYALPVSFDNQTIHADEFYWEFGDQQVSFEESPTHFYQQDGSFDVTLYVEGNGFCHDTLRYQDLIEIHPKPYADFGYENVDEDPPMGNVEFFNYSAGEELERFTWVLGDGSQVLTLSDSSFIHAYDRAGSYEGFVIAQNRYGCLDTSTVQSINVDYFAGLFFPNAFTPTRGPEEVRVFQPKGVGLETFHVEIFNKWGERVWEAHLDEVPNGHELPSWDGKHYRTGKDLPQGSYVWKAQASFQNGKGWAGQQTRRGSNQKVGTVTIIK